MAYETDKLAFINFLAQFVNTVMGVKLKYPRLQLLKKNLSDYSTQIIQHLTILDENCAVTIHISKIIFWIANL